MAMLTSKTWIMVADGERAMILENAGDTRDVVLRQRKALTAAAVVGASDRPGRMADNGPNQRSAMEQPDFARLAADGLAADVVAHLLEQVGKAGFEQLVLIAPPQVLGAVRDRLPPALQAVVVAEIPKTLTKHPLPKIADIVVEALAVA
ncbi:host attachment family protein [Paracoccaceae bacterium Fryx2]|nr:host attachment family protein [Paracoccaceae bacterium Fryx2]